MRTGDLAPDDPDLGSPDGLLGAVDVGYTLTSIPLCRLGGIDAFKLEERGSGVGVSLAALVGNVLSLHVDCASRVLSVSVPCVFRQYFIAAIQQKSC